MKINDKVAIKRINPENRLFYTEAIILDISELFYILKEGMFLRTTNRKLDDWQCELVAITPKVQDEIDRLKIIKMVYEDRETWYKIPIEHLREFEQIFKEYQ